MGSHGAPSVNAKLIAEQRTALSLLLQGVSEDVYSNAEKVQELKESITQLRNGFDGKLFLPEVFQPARSGSAKMTKAMFLMLAHVLELQKADGTPFPCTSCDKVDKVAESVAASMMKAGFASAPLSIDLTSSQPSNEVLLSGSSVSSHDNLPSEVSSSASSSVALSEDMPPAPNKLALFCLCESIAFIKKSHPAWERSSTQLYGQSSSIVSALFARSRASKARARNVDIVPVGCEFAHSAHDPYLAAKCGKLNLLTNAHARILTPTPDKDDQALHIVDGTIRSAQKIGNGEVRINMRIASDQPVHLPQLVNSQRSTYIMPDSEASTSGTTNVQNVSFDCQINDLTHHVYLHGEPFQLSESPKFKSYLNLVGFATEKQGGGGELSCLPMAILRLLMSVGGLSKESQIDLTSGARLIRAAAASFLMDARGMLCFLKSILSENDIRVDATVNSVLFEIINAAIVRETVDEFDLQSLFDAGIPLAEQNSSTRESTLSAILRSLDNSATDVSAESIVTALEVVREGFVSGQDSTFVNLSVYSLLLSEAGLVQLVTASPTTNTVGLSVINPSSHLPFGIVYWVKKHFEAVVSVDCSKLSVVNDQHRRQNRSILQMWKSILKVNPVRGFPPASTGTGKPMPHPATSSSQTHPHQQGQSPQAPNEEEKKRQEQEEKKRQEQEEKMRKEQEEKKRQEQEEKKRQEQAESKRKQEEESKRLKSKTKDDVVKFLDSKPTIKRSRGAAATRALKQGVPAQFVYKALQSNGCVFGSLCPDRSACNRAHRQVPSDAKPAADSSNQSSKSDQVANSKTGNRSSSESSTKADETKVTQKIEVHLDAKVLAREFAKFNTFLPLAVADDDGDDDSDDDGDDDDKPVNKKRGKSGRRRREEKNRHGRDDAKRRNRKSDEVPLGALISHLQRLYSKSRSE